MYVLDTRSPMYTIIAICAMSNAKVYITCALNNSIILFSIEPPINTAFDIVSIESLPMLQASMYKIQLILLHIMLLMQLRLPYLFVFCFTFVQLFTWYSLCDRYIHLRTLSLDSFDYTFLTSLSCVHFSYVPIVLQETILIPII